MLLGLLWVLVILIRNNKKIDKLTAAIEKREEITRKEVEKELDELNEIIET